MKINLVIIVAKALLYALLGHITIADLEWVPFLTTRYQNESNVNEAKFFMDNN